MCRQLGRGGAMFQLFIRSASYCGANDNSNLIELRVAPFRDLDSSTQCRSLNKIEGARLERRPFAQIRAPSIAGDISRNPKGDIELTRRQLAGGDCFDDLAGDAAFRRHVEGFEERTLKMRLQLARGLAVRKRDLRSQPSEGIGIQLDD